MKVDSSLYLRMIGDYYLHAYVLKHTDIVKNNYTSSLIEEMFNGISNSIYGQMFKYGNKTKITIGLFKIDIQNNIKFYDIYNNEVTEYYGIISPFDGKFYTDNTEITKQANIHRTSNGLCYFVLKGDINFIMEITETIKKMSVSDFSKTIINKIILLNPDNKKFIIDIISIILGAPYCVSPEGETVIEVGENYIVTDKNSYSFDYAISYPKVGSSFYFCEPVIKLCSVNNTAIKYNINYIRLNKVKTFNNNLYNDTISKALIDNLIYIDIPIEIASENSEILKDISYVFKNLKIIFSESVSSKTDSSDIRYVEESKNILSSTHIFNTIENHSLTFDYYNQESIFNFKENYKYGLVDSSDITYKEDVYMSSSKHNINIYGINDETDIVQLESENIEIYYVDFKSSSLNDYDIGNLRENYSNYVQTLDYNNMFDDYFEVNIIDTNIVKIVETEKETIKSSNLDYMLSQSDIQNISSYHNESVTTVGFDIKSSYLSRFDKTKIEYGFKTNIVSSETLNANDTFGFSNIDKEDVSVYNTNSFETLTVETEIQIIKTEDEMSVMVKDILNTNDEMLVNSDTNIDKE